MVIKANLSTKQHFQVTCGTSSETLNKKQREHWNKRSEHHRKCHPHQQVPFKELHR